jgi:integrase
LLWYTYWPRDPRIGHRRAYRHANPCHIKGAGNFKRVHKVTTLTLDELAALVDAMPERYQPMTLLAAWCGLRFGEFTELRRKDIDIANGVVFAVRSPGWPESSCQHSEVRCRRP